MLQKDQFVAAGSAEMTQCMVLSYRRHDMAADRRRK
jgi:hypothetical protein